MVQYIVDFYEELPRWMVFVHAHNSSEHMPDKVDVLQVGPCVPDLALAVCVQLAVPDLAAAATYDAMIGSAACQSMWPM